MVPLDAVAAAVFVLQGADQSRGVRVWQRGAVTE